MWVEKQPHVVGQWVSGIWCAASSHLLKQLCHAQQRLQGPDEGGVAGAGQLS